jgi:hypothetical protein
LNLSNVHADQHDMLALLITLLIAYGAYRAFRGGFQRPQSERLTGYGIIGIGVALLILLSLIDWLFPNLL